MTSVTEAREAGTAVLVDWRSARAEQERLEALKSPAELSLGPIPLTLPSLSTTPTSAEDMRLLAWDAIAEYSKVLASLNSGESVEEVKQTAGRLVGLATTLSSAVVPGSEVLTGLFKELAGKLEGQRQAAEFKKAVHNGAPIIHQIINEVLIPDTADHYRLRASLLNRAYAHVDLEKDLSDKDKLLKKARIEAEAAAFADSLLAYKATLERLDSSLTAMEQAVDAPVNFSVQADRVLSMALGLKRQWDLYQAVRREGHP